MTQVQVRPSGPDDAEIMIVGEAPGREEVARGVPFVGMSGMELDRMLAEAGIIRQRCFVTNVCRVQPPGNDISAFFTNYDKASRTPGEEIRAGMTTLLEEISLVKPKVIIALGDTALWALTGQRGITKWRGSQIATSVGGHPVVVIPTFHPAAILRMWEWRFQAVLDLKRARRVLMEGNNPPPKDYIIRPSYTEVMEFLTKMPPGVYSLDIETRAGHIACIGIGSSRTRAICIPFMCVERPEGYWSFDEEFAISEQLRRVFKRQGVSWVLQNGLYDVQYIARYLGVIVSVYMDTMLAQHAIYPGIPKSLDFLSSMYKDHHLYWKDDGKEWAPHMGEDQLWIYNCDDCTATYEIAEKLQNVLREAGAYYRFQFLMDLFPIVFRMMLHGIACDEGAKQELTKELHKAKDEIQSWLDSVIGRRLNINSPPQMAQFLYWEMNLRPIKRRRKNGGYSVTTDDDALVEIAEKNPILRPIIRRIQLLRSIKVFTSTFAEMELDRDRRIRCSFNIGGTETYRFSSSKNAFGSGTNLQNVPTSGGEELYHLPNIKKFFVPDEGCELCDADLERADAYVVAWEADDDELKSIFRSGADLHLENAKAIFGAAAVKLNPQDLRQKAKVGVHAADYGAQPPTLAKSLGITRHSAEIFLRRWFEAHPGIPEWHRRTSNQLQTSRSVANAFGFRRYYFDRIDSILSEALAWVPQSTVALVICKALVRMKETAIQPLLQVHDSILWQYPKDRRAESHELIKLCMSVPVPYDDQLIIPVELKVSDKSWGDCKKVV